MNKKINITPVKKISNFLNMDIEIKNNKITNVNTSKIIYSSKKNIINFNIPINSLCLLNKKNFSLFTIEDFLSYILAVENCLNISPNKNSKKIRDFIYGFKFIKEHLIDFYLYIIPDFVKIPNSPFLYNTEDFRLPKKLNKKIYNDYLISLKYIAITDDFLNKYASICHNIFIGGAKINLNILKDLNIKSILKNLKNFINHNMIEDINLLSNYYTEYFKNGVSFNNLMSFGCFNYEDDKELSYVTPKTYINGVFNSLDCGLISESICHFTHNDKFKSSVKSNKFCWVKSSRYNKYSVEVGPLSRMILSNNYKFKISTMDRIYARVLETKKIIEIMEVLIKIIRPSKIFPSFYKFPLKGSGKGLLDTPNGSLGNWIYIYNSSMDNYNRINPYSWNLSSKDSNGVKGVIEKALLGTNISNIENPIEIPRIVHSFDPCASCNINIEHSQKN